jgi:hypothetical protein
LESGNTAYTLGRVVGMLVAVCGFPLILMAAVAAILYLRGDRDRRSFGRTLLQWPVLLAGVGCLVLMLLGTLANALRNVDLDTDTASAPAATAAPVPSDFETFSSRSQPYSIGYPAEWDAQTDAYTYEDLHYDVFTGDGATVTLGSEKLPGAIRISEEFYVQRSISGIEEDGVTVRRAGETVAGGRRAYLLTHVDGEDEFTQAVWLDGDRGWVASLSNPIGERAQHQPVFEEMLRTFRARPEAGDT